MKKILPLLSLMISPRIKSFKHISYILQTFSSKCFECLPNQLEDSRNIEVKKGSERICISRHHILYNIGILIY